MKIKPNPKDEILPVIAKAIISGAYDFTSKNSLRIYYAKNKNGVQEVVPIEVEWKI